MVGVPPEWFPEGLIPLVRVFFLSRSLY